MGLFFMLSSASFAEITDEQYTLKMKNFKEERQRIVQEHNQEMQKLESEYSLQLKAFGNTPADQIKKGNYQHLVQQQRDELKAAFKDKMNFIEQAESELRLSRQKRTQPQLSSAPDGKNIFSQAELKNQNKAMEEFQKRVKEQDKDIQKELGAAKAKPTKNTPNIKNRTSTVPKDDPLQKLLNSSNASPQSPSLQTPSAASASATTPAPSTPKVVYPKSSKNKKKKYGNY